MVSSFGVFINTAHITLGVLDLVSSPDPLACARGSGNETNAHVRKRVQCSE